MDIRNFFGAKPTAGGKKTAVPAPKKKKAKKATKVVIDDDSDATTDMDEPTPKPVAKSKPKATEKKGRVEVDASAFFAKSSSGASKPKSATKKPVGLDDLDEDTPPKKKKAPPVDLDASSEEEAKKPVVDLDADTSEDESPPKRSRATTKKKKAPPVDLDADTSEDEAPKRSKKKTPPVDLDADTSEEDEAPPKRSRSTKKKKAPPVDLDADTSEDDSPPKRGKKSNEPVDLDADTSEDESPPPKRSKPKRKVESDNDDEDDDVDFEENSEDSPPPAKKARSTKKATKKKAPVYDDDDDDMSEDDDEAPPPKRSTTKRKKVESDDDDDDDDEVEFDFKENVVVKASPPKKTRKTTPKKATPKRSPRKKAPVKKEKEPLLEPTLELDSFDTDDATPTCLAGLTFVFSGVLPGLPRDDSVDYVKILGGRVTGAVSSKTSFLVVGEILEDGRPYTDGSKYKKATEIGVTVVKGEKALYGLCKLYSDKLKPAAAVKEATASPVVSNPYATASKAANPYAKKPAVTNPYAKKAPTNPYAKKSANPYAVKSESEPTAAVSSGDPNALWADKYAPTSTRDILGNQDSVRKLTQWLDRWEHTFNNEKAYNKTFSAPGGPWKAALLSGPPGIGKTTTATLVAAAAGRNVLELNASDARSKKALETGLGDVTGSQVLNFGGKAKNKKPQRRCIIMDEVDGMGAGDRSGMSELIKMIKNSRVPIICICNDRQSQKMKSLLSYCMDLRYKRPVKSVIARRAIRIGETEGMTIEQNAAEAIAESCGNDIRQVLNSLQMWSCKKQGGDTITYKGLKERQSAIKKDEILRVSMFDATKLIIEGRRGLAGADAKAQKDSLYKRSEAYFVDYSLMGINVHQNYLKVMVGGYQEAARSKDDDKMDAFVERMHDATLAMSDFAVGDQAVRGGDMNWGLLPFVSMMTVKTGFHAGGPNGGFLGGFPEFAGWMGKNSSRGKKTRLLSELGYHMNYKVSTDKADLRLRYIPVLRERFAGLLADGDKTKIAEAIGLMDEYGLDRDDVFENLDEFKIDPKAKGFSDLDSKQKTAFTKAYNQGIHKSQALVHEQGAGKVAKKAKASRVKDPADLDAVDDDKVEESDEEEDEVSEELLKKMFGKKGRKSGGSKKKAPRKSK